MADTTIQEESFRVVLPGDWRLTERPPEGGVWVYQAATGQEGLTVSVRYFNAAYGPDEVRQSMMAYVRIRRSASSETNPSASISPDKVEEYPTACANTFLEKGPGDRKAANKTIATRIGIANFYYESYEDEAAFLGKVQSLLSTTGFAS